MINFPSGEDVSRRGFRISCEAPTGTQKPPRQYKKGRRCRGCGHPMSVYTPGKQCNPCKNGPQ